MIARVWRGWATHANADAYEAFMRDKFIPAVLATDIEGLREIQLLRLARAALTEFMIIMHFDTLDAVRRYAGDDYEKPVIPVKERELLRRFDPRAEHFEVRLFRKS